MPQFGHYKKVPVMLGENLSKAKNMGSHFRHGEMYDGHPASRPALNLRNIPYGAVKKMLGRVAERGLERVERMGTQAIENITDRALNKVLGMEKR